MRTSLVQDGSLEVIVNNAVIYCQLLKHTGFEVHWPVSMPLQPLREIAQLWLTSPSKFNIKSERIQGQCGWTCVLFINQSCKTTPQALIVLPIIDKTLLENRLTQAHTYKSTYVHISSLWSLCSDILSLI